MERIDHTLTINQLLELCKEQVKSGNWDKKILISKDDDGNGYHNLYYSFTDDYDEIKEVRDFYWIGDIMDDLENYVLLG